MSSATIERTDRAAPDWIRNALVRAFGWRGLLWQHDQPTVDRWRWLRRHLRPGPLRTLDAGSGSGVFAIYAAARGNEALGLSFDPDANAMASRRAALLGLDRIRFRTVDLRLLEQIAGELGTFDQIICFETIEHLVDDRKLVAGLAGLLRPGGRLLLTTPTAEHPPLVGETLSTTEDGGHVRWGYTGESLRDLFESLGLEPVVVDRLSGVWTQHQTNLARRLSRVVGVRAAWAVTMPLRAARLFDRPLTQLLRREWLAIGVVGRKR